MKASHFTIGTLVLLLTSGATVSRAEVLHDRVNGPLIGRFGLPDSSEGANLLSSGTFAWGISYGVASHSIDQESGAELLYLDGETSRADLRVRYGVADNWELGIDLPWVGHSGGRLDGLIDAWHDAFQLPEGQRPDRDQNVLQFLYADSADVPVDVTRSASGVGDVRLLAARRVINGNHNGAFRVSVKFATGDAENFLGSGGTDFSVGWASDYSSLFGSDRWNAFYRLNMLYLGEPEVLADRTRQWAGQVTAGAGFDLTSSIELRLQAGWRSALYDSEINYLGRSSTTLTFGGNIQLGDRYQLSLAIGEDADVTSAPDVSFLLALRYR